MGISAHLARRLLVVDQPLFAHLYDGLDGSELLNIPLTDRALTICTSGGEALIALNDERHVLVDFEHAVARPQSKRPAYCPRMSTFDPDDSCQVRARKLPTRLAACEDLVGRGGVKGFAAAFGLAKDDAHVVLGYRSPGTEVPMAIGLDGKAKDRAKPAILWQRALPSGDLAHAAGLIRGVAELEAGVLYVAYTTYAGGAWLSALDAKTGEQLWQAKLAHEADSLALGKTHAYVAGGTRLMAFDRKSGAELRTPFDR
jgi:hypothetical protein